MHLVTRPGLSRLVAPSVSSSSSTGGHGGGGYVGGGDVDQHLVDFPPDDIEVNVVEKSKKIRTMNHVLPEETL